MSEANFKNAIRAILGVIFCTFIFLSYFYSGQKSSFESFLSSTNSRGILDVRYNDLLKNYPLNNTKFDQVCVNPKQHKTGCLDIYIIDSRKKFPHQYESIREKLKLNAIALDANTLIIDSYILDFLFVYGVRRNLLYGTGLENEFDWETLTAFNWHQNFNNMKREFSREKYNDTQHNNDFWQPVKSEVDMYLNSFDFPEGDSLWYTSMLFGPLIEHEIFHLLDQDNGGTANLYNRLSLLTGRSEIIEFERKADEYAFQSSIDILFKKFEKIEDEVLVELEANNFDTSYLTEAGLSSVKKQNLTSVSDYFFTAALFDLFEGFRGLPSDELFIKHFFEKCEKPDERLHIPFGTPSEIQISRFSSPPLMTSEEFERLSHSLVPYSDEIESTHDHKLLRGIFINDRLRQEDASGIYDNRDFEGYENLITSLISGDPELLNEKYYRHRTPIILENPNLLNELLSDERSQECTFGNCYIHSFGKDGYIEIIIEDNKIYRLEGYINIREDNQEEYFGTMLEMLALFLALDLDKDEATAAMEEIRLDSMRCGFGSGAYISDKIEIVATSVDPHGTMFLKAFPTTKLGNDRLYLEDTLNKLLADLDLAVANNSELTEVGVVYYRLGNYAAALEYFTRVFKNSPAEFVIYHNLASAELGVGNHKRAIQLFLDGIEIAKNEETAIPDRTYERLAIAYRESGEIEKADYFLNLISANVTTK